MKKLIALLLILSLSTFAFVSCNPPETPEDPGSGEQGNGNEGGNEDGGEGDGTNIDPNGWTNS